MMRRQIRLFSLALALLVTGCGSAQWEVPAGTFRPRNEPVRIAVVLPSSKTDLSWSASMAESLAALQERVGDEEIAEIAYSEGMPQVADASAAIRNYALQGYDLVIAHGTQYQSSVLEIARDFPETSFALGTSSYTGGDRGIENLFAYRAAAAEGGYVNGVVAAMLSRSKIVGVIGHFKGDATPYHDGFLLGAHDTDREVQVRVIYTGSFTDLTLAAEAARAHIQSGADVLTGSGQQAVGAIAVAAEEGVFWLGTQSGQIMLEPTVVAGNQIYDWSHILSDMIDKIQSGQLGGTAYRLTLANEGLRYIFNGNLALAEEISDAAQVAIEEIKKGTIAFD